VHRKQPWFLAFNAQIELHPAMTLGDLSKAAPAIERAIERFREMVASERTQLNARRVFCVMFSVSRALTIVGALSKRKSRENATLKRRATATVRSYGIASTESWEIMRMHKTAARTCFVKSCSRTKDASFMRRTYAGWQRAGRSTNCGNANDKLDRSGPTCPTFLSTYQAQSNARNSTNYSAGCAKAYRNFQINRRKRFG
jgi:hypothetical protein